MAETKSKGRVLIIVAFAAVVWLMSMFWDTAEAYGEKCDSFNEGYRDGWCAEERYGCYGPGYYPVCVETDYQNERQAYHRGYELGKDARH